MSTSRAFSEQISEAAGSGRHVAIDGDQQAEATAVYEAIMLRLPHFPSGDVRCAYEEALEPPKYFQVKLSLFP